MLISGLRKVWFEFFCGEALPYFLSSLTPFFPTIGCPKSKLFRWNSSLLLYWYSYYLHVSGSVRGVKLCGLSDENKNCVVLCYVFRCFLFLGLVCWGLTFDFSWAPSDHVWLPVFSNRTSVPEKINMAVYESNAYKPKHSLFKYWCKVISNIFTCVVQGFSHCIMFA